MPWVSVAPSSSPSAPCLEPALTSAFKAPVLPWLGNPGPAAEFLPYLLWLPCSPASRDQACKNTVGGRSVQICSRLCFKPQGLIPIPRVSKCPWVSVPPHREPTPQAPAGLRPGAHLPQALAATCIPLERRGSGFQPTFCVLFTYFMSSPGVQDDERFSRYEPL